MSDTEERDNNVEASDEAKTEENEQLEKSDLDKKKHKKSKKKKKKKGANNESKESIPSSKMKKNADDEQKGDKKGETSISDKKEAAATNSDDDDNDDDDLLAAAALWAGKDPEEEETEKPSHQSSLPGPLGTATSRQNYSLHITQLPYDSTDFDLRKLFAEHGCSITSIRLVYDRDTEGRKTVFRGVAFVDFLDSQSYETAIKLHHKTSIRGRRLNVRPCRSKEELAEIVARTQELVKEKIRQQLSGDGVQSSATSKERGSSSPSPKSNENKSNTSKRKNNNQKERKNSKKPKVDKDGKAIKLTKKERNRRAAILMQKRRRQNK